MDQTKLIGELANDVTNDNTENQSPASIGATEIRPLGELELMIASGGDAIVVW